MLQSMFKGLMEWFYGLVLEIVEYISNGLLAVFSMDLDYFEAAMPVTGDIINIIIASGWALLLGNLVFQAAKSMMSGLGFEGEDSKSLFARTFVFGFLLLTSRQVCDIGLGISKTVIEMLQVPSSVSVSPPDGYAFHIGASWLLMIIVGVALMWQLVKLFLEVGERYVLVGFLTIAAPWAFAMGGSRNTSDIFKGWARMFASMCLMMVLNVVVLKMFLSAMGNIPDDGGIIAWLILVIAIARVVRKIDDVITRIGLNPAITGGGQGRSLPGSLAYMVIKSLSSNIIGAIGSSAAGTAKAAASSGTHNAAKAQLIGRRNSVSNWSTANNRTVGRSSTSQGAANNQSNQSSTSQQTENSSLVNTAPIGTASSVTTVIAQNNNAAINHPMQSVENGVTRRSSVAQPSNVRSSIVGSGAAGTTGAISPQTGQNEAWQEHTALASSQQQTRQIPVVNAPVTVSQGAGKSQRSTRYTSVPVNIRNASANSKQPGVAGKEIQQNSTILDKPLALSGAAGKAGHSVNDNAAIDAVRGDAKYRPANQPTQRISGLNNPNSGKRGSAGSNKTNRKTHMDGSGVNEQQYK